jgi:hypothetical protein
MARVVKPTLGLPIVIPIVIDMHHLSHLPRLLHKKTS